jgi:hypothetical protein
MIRHCPDCGAILKPYGRGATARKHGPRWTCPIAELNGGDTPSHRWMWRESDFPAEAITPPLADQFRDSTEKIAKLETRWNRLYYGAEDYDDVYYAEQAQEQLTAERKHYNELLEQVS